MSNRPLIAVPPQTLEERPGELPRCWVMSQRYIITLANAGGLPVTVSLLEDEATMRATYETMDGIFLCGGVDLDPSSYAESRHHLCGNTDPARDKTELQLVRWAIEDKKPVFGVCRGVQLINVATGGTLYQDIANECPGTYKHDYFPVQGRYSRDLLSHAVTVDTESRLGSLLGVRSVKVNSMHHQAIRRLGHGLVATAWATDGVIEAVESIHGHYLMGVQWHPEELAATDPRMRRLFSNFIRECQRYSERRNSKMSLVA